MTCTVAKTSDEVRAAWSLLYRSYLAAGFISPNPLGIYLPYYTVPEEAVILAHNAQGSLTGTITTIGDSKAGLPSDERFPNELKAIRGHCKKLVEIGQLAGDQDVFDLMRWAFFWGIAIGATDVICEVPPKRIKSYGRLMGFEQIGTTKPFYKEHKTALLVANIFKSTINRAQHKVMRYFVNNPIEAAAYKDRYDFTKG